LAEGDGLHRTLDQHRDHRHSAADDGGDRTGAMMTSIMANVARGWNRDPAASICGSPASGVSAALWTHDEDNVQEVAGDPDPGQHMICLMHAGIYSAELWKDGRPAFDKPAPRDGVCIINAGVVPRAVHRGRWSIMHLYMPDGLVKGLVEDEGLAARASAVELIDPQLNIDHNIARISRQVEDEMKAEAPLSRLRVDVLGLDLAISLIRRHSNLSDTPKVVQAGRPKGLAPWQVNRTIDFLKSDISQDPSLALLAQQSRLSAFHFARAFRESTGLPPHRYLIHLRLERARELLETSDLAITEIAAQVGYEDPGHLARLFRRRFGTTPAIYRRERRG